MADDVCNIPAHFWFTPLLENRPFLKTPKKVTYRRRGIWKHEKYGTIWKLANTAASIDASQRTIMACSIQLSEKNHRPRHQRRCCTSREFPPNSALPQVKTRPFTKMAANAPQDAANFTTLLISNNSERRRPGERCQ